MNRNGACGGSYSNNEDIELYSPDQYLKAEVMYLKIEQNYDMLYVGSNTHTGSYSSYSEWDIVPPKVSADQTMNVIRFTSDWTVTDVGWTIKLTLSDQTA